MCAKLATPRSAPPTSNACAGSSSVGVGCRRSHSRTLVSPLADRNTSPWCGDLRLCVFVGVECVWCCVRGGSLVSPLADRNTQQVCGDLGLLRNYLCVRLCSTKCGTGTSCGRGAHFAPAAALSKVYPATAGMRVVALPTMRRGRRSRCGPQTSAGCPGAASTTA